MLKQVVFYPAERVLTRFLFQTMNSFIGILIWQLNISENGRSQPF